MAWLLRSFLPEDTGCAQRRPKTAQAQALANRLAAREVPSKEVPSREVPSPTEHRRQEPILDLARAHPTSLSAWLQRDFDPKGEGSTQRTKAKGGTVSEGRRGGKRGPHREARAFVSIPAGNA